MYEYNSSFWFTEFEVIKREITWSYQQDVGEKKLISTDIIIVAIKSIICGKSDIFQYIMILIYWNNTFPVGRIKLHWRTTLSLLVSFKHSIIICDFLLDKHQKSLSSKHVHINDEHFNSNLEISILEKFIKLFLM